MVAPHFRAFRLAGNGVRSCRSQSGRGGRFFRGKQEKGRKEYGDGKGNSQKAEQDEAPLFFRACHIAHSVPSLGNLQANRLNLPVSGKHQPRRNRHLITFGVARSVDHGCPGGPHQGVAGSDVVLAVVVPDKHVIGTRLHADTHGFSGERGQERPAWRNPPFP